MLGLHSESLLACCWHTYSIHVWSRVVVSADPMLEGVGVRFLVLMFQEVQLQTLDSTVMCWCLTSTLGYLILLAANIWTVYMCIVSIINCSCKNLHQWDTFLFESHIFRCVLIVMVNEPHLVCILYLSETRCDSLSIIEDQNTDGTKHYRSLGWETSACYVQLTDALLLASCVTDN